MHLILNTNFNNAFKITLFGMPGGAFFMGSLPLTLEPGYATESFLFSIVTPRYTKPLVAGMSSI